MHDFELLTKLVFTGRLLVFQPGRSIPAYHLTQEQRICWKLGRRNLSSVRLHLSPWYSGRNHGLVLRLTPIGRKEVVTGVLRRMSRFGYGHVHSSEDHCWLCWTQCA